MMKDLKEIGTLEELVFFDDDIGPEEMPDCKSLATLPHLKTLCLIHTGLTSAGLTMLAELKHVEVLDISIQNKLADADFSALKSMKSLKEIVIDQTPLGEAAKVSLKSLKNIKISGNPDVVY
jgi:hypothetical protein